MTPSQSQVVFEGDKLPFTCHASSLDGHTQLHWERFSKPVAINKTQDMLIQTLEQNDE